MRLLMTGVLLAMQCHGATAATLLAQCSHLCHVQLRGSEQNQQIRDIGEFIPRVARPHLGGELAVDRCRTPDASARRLSNARLRSRARMSSAPDLSRSLRDHDSHEDAAGLDATSTPVTQLTRQFREWRAQLEAEGWWEREPLTEAMQLAVWALAVAAGVIVTWSRSAMPRVPRNMLAVLMLAAANSRASWLAHDYRHGTDKFCKLMRPFGALAVGVGATFWFEREHNLHHAMTNEVGADKNLLAANIVWLWPPNQASDRPWRRWQHIYIPFISVALFPALRLQSLQFAWRHRAERGIGTQELAPLMLHYLLLYAACGCSLLRMVAVVALSSVFTTVIALSLHQTEELFFERQTDWVSAQLRATRNSRLTNPLSEWIWGGMNYHIEHHLFPTMPSSKYAKLSPLLKQWCEARGIEYRVDDEIDVLRRNFALYKYVAEAPVDASAPDAINA
jgi:fatty acid desaturase